MNTSNGNMVMISPAWDSLIRSLILVGGTTLAVTGHGTPDQINAISTTAVGAIGSIFALGSALWGVTRGASVTGKVTN